MISEDALYQELGRRLREARRKGDGRAKLTQDQLANLVGLERTSISNIEKGIQRIPLHVLYKLCIVLNIDLLGLLPTVESVKQQSQKPVVKLNGASYFVSPKALEAVNNIVANNQVEHHVD